jgi:hypothetical protein
MSMIKKTDVVGSGGSVTLDECGIRDALRKGGYRFLDWFKDDLSAEQRRKILLDGMSSDVFLTGANAITEDGKLYNIDGRGNRVAGLIFGPKKVIVVAGMNKIVKDLFEAKERLETVAAPKNAARLHKETGCMDAGYCVDCCRPDRLCCHTVITERQQTDRIEVIIVDEELGF